MRRKILVASVVCLGFVTACNDKKSDSSGSSSPAAETPSGEPTGSDTSTATTPPVQAGQVALGTISGEILPKEGADAKTAVGALVVAEGHPEITGTTDDTGKFQIENVLPGSVALMVTSGGGAGLAAPAAAAYGLKIPEVLVKAGATADLGKQTLKKTGGLKGKVTFFSNPNNLDLTGSDVFVPGTSFLAKTDAAGAFAMNGLPPGSYQVRLQHTGFAVLDLKDLEVAEGAVTDLGDVALSLSNGPEGKVSVTASTMSIGGHDKKVATSRDVSMTLTYDQDAALMMVSDEPSFLNKEWKPIAETVPWHFESDGAKTLYVKYSDLNGLESSPFSDEVIVDTLPPVLTSAIVMNDWVSSAKLTIFVDVVSSDAGTGIKQIRFKNESDSFTETGVNGWQAFNSNMDWTLSAGADGTRTVHAQVKDYVGNVSNVVSDEIGKSVYTRVAQKNHGKTIVLRKEQSPFLFEPAGDAFDVVDDVDVGADVEIVVHSGTVGSSASDLHPKVLNLNGKVTATGTAGHPVTFRGVGSQLYCDSSVSFKNAIDGVSSNNRIQFAVFTRLAAVEFKGGVVSNSQFNYHAGCEFGASSPEGLWGNVIKYGQESLTIKDSTFDHWDIGMRNESGANNVVLENNSGSVRKLLVHDKAGSGTTVSGGSYTRSTNTAGTFVELKKAGSATLKNLVMAGTGTSDTIEISAGSLSLQNSTLNTCNRGVSIIGSATSTVSVSDTIFNSCGVGVAQMSDSDDSLATISGATEFLTSTNYGITCDAHGDVTYKAATVVFTNGKETSDSTPGYGEITTF